MTFATILVIYVLAAGICFSIHRQILTTRNSYLILCVVQKIQQFVFPHQTHLFTDLSVKEMKCDFLIC